MALVSFSWLAYLKSMVCSTSCMLFDCLDSNTDGSIIVARSIPMVCILSVRTKTSKPIVTLGTILLNNKPQHTNAYFPPWRSSSGTSGMEGGSRRWNVCL